MMKYYFGRLRELLQQKAVRLFVLVIGGCYLLSFKQMFYPVRLMITLVIASFILQYLLLVKNSFVFYVVRTILLIVLCFEWVFGKLNARNEAVAYTEVSEKYIVPDEEMGFRNADNFGEARRMLVNGNDTIFNVPYRTDSIGRRIVPVGADSSVRNRHAVFIGCSYTFGYGLDSNATFPYLFQEAMPGYRSYNYGIYGSGPHQWVFLFRPGKDLINHRTILQDSGVAVYTFINDHLTRVFGGSQYLLFGASTPDVFVDHDTLVVKPRSKWRNRLARECAYWQTLRYFHFGWYYNSTEAYFRRFAGLLNYTAKKYYENFPHGQFYVVIYPDEKPQLAWKKYLSDKINFIEVPLPADYMSHQEKYLLHPTHDLHPNALLNKYYVDYLAGMIKNK